MKDRMVSRKRFSKFFPPLFSWVAALFLIGCVAPRKIDRPQRCFDYNQDIQPILKKECGSCHTGEQAAADYQTGSYLLTIGVGVSGVSAVKMIDKSTLLERKVSGEVSHDVPHPTLNDHDRATLSRWIHECNVSMFATHLIHPQTWTNPDSEQFHGLWLQIRGYDYSVCERCHGDSNNATDGGLTGATCNECHADTPYGCDTCHGLPPLKHGHLQSLNGQTLTRTKCHLCHSQTMDSEGEFIVDSAGSSTHLNGVIDFAR